MNYFDEIEQRHYEQYETDPGYRIKFDAEQVERSAMQDQMEEQETRERNEAGRYTLDEAAKFIGDNSKASVDSILAKLKHSADTGELTVYKPGSNETYKKRTAVLGWYEEVLWNDLNKWLESNEPLLGCLFPQPEAKGKAGAESQDSKELSGIPVKERARVLNEWCAGLYVKHDGDADIIKSEINRLTNREIAVECWKIAPKAEQYLWAERKSPTASHEATKAAKDWLDRHGNRIWGFQKKKGK